MLRENQRKTLVHSRAIRAPITLPKHKYFHFQSNRSDSPHRLVIYNRITKGKKKKKKKKKEKKEKKKKKKKTPTQRGKM